ncbi:MAG: family 43 glycosylhydrolase, partial [Spirochaetales bacterium]|nr:family 43 glycosylhydrolase [Spirochaetales bacterium]
MKKELFFLCVFGKKSICMLLMCGFLFVAAFPGYSDNPIFTNTYTADPSPYIGQDGRLYVICSHDNPNATGYDLLKNYVLYSTTDMVSWQDHGIVFDVNNVSWANLAYAPSVCYRNGKYYLYFPNGASSIGVATSTSPTGPFTDVLGRAMVDKNTPNSNVEWCFDP